MFNRLKRKHYEIRMRADQASAVARAESMRRVFDHGYSERLRKRRDRGQRCRDPTIVDDYDRTGAGGHASRNRRCAYVAVRGIDIGPYRMRASMQDGEVSRFGGHCGRDHLVSCRDTGED